MYIDINRYPYGFPMVFLWFFYGFPMVFLWFFYGFPMVFYGFPMVFYGFPMVFLWFSYGFPMVFLSKDPKKTHHRAEKFENRATKIKASPPAPASELRTQQIWRFVRSFSRTANSRGFIECFMGVCGDSYGDSYGILWRFHQIWWFHDGLNGDFMGFHGDSYGIWWWFHQIWWFHDGLNGDSYEIFHEILWLIWWFVFAMISSPNIGLRVVGDVKKKQIWFLRLKYIWDFHSYNMNWNLWLNENRWKSIEILQNSRVHSDFRSFGDIDS